MTVALSISTIALMPSPRHRRVIAGLTYRQSVAQRRILRLLDEVTMSHSSLLADANAARLTEMEVLLATHFPEQCEPSEARALAV